MATYMNTPIFRETKLNHWNGTPIEEEKGINIDITGDNKTVNMDLESEKSTVLTSKFGATMINNFNSCISSSINEVDDKIENLKKEVDNLKNIKRKKIKRIKISFSSK